MEQLNYDPGLTQQYTSGLRRALNRNGDFNVRRLGNTWRDSHPYLYLINASWTRFFLMVGVAFILVNVLFASTYAWIGFDHLKGAAAETPFLRFLNAFFFSAHTLTTVGYGNMWPVGPLANTVAALESLLGVLAFAIATGLLFGRFARPSARIGFSAEALIAPYQGARSLQFRIVNRRSNNLIEVEARLLLMRVENCDGKLQRRFAPLSLERPSVLFLPLTWVVVHPINADSPLSRLSAADLEREQAELLVMITAFDESFGQNVHIRYSYRYDEIIWGARFEQAFEVAPDGRLHLDISRVSEYRPEPLPEEEKDLLDSGKEAGSATDKSAPPVIV